MHASRGVLRGFISRENNVAIVLSTLVIAVLFQLLRQGIQQSIDLGFYRGKYDAARLWQPSTPPCAQEVDLDWLREHLLAVVQETMQPTHVSLLVA